MNFSTAQKQLISQIRADKTSGAMQIATHTLRRILPELIAPQDETTPLDTYIRNIKQVASVLDQQRPTMAPIGNVVCSVLSRALAVDTQQQKSAAQLHQSILDEIQHSSAKIEESNKEIAENFVSACRDKMTLSSRQQQLRVLTLSYSSSVVQALAAAAKANLLEHVYVMESRPAREGTTMILKLHERAPSLKMTLLTDAAAPKLVSSGTVDLMTCGADSIEPDGSFVNKTGTSILNMLASESCQLLVLCDTLKVRAQVAEQPELEHGEVQDELIADLQSLDSRDAMLKLLKDGVVDTWNPIFERVTPVHSQYVRVVTELGTQNIKDLAIEFSVIRAKERKSLGF